MTQKAQSLEANLRRLEAALTRGAAMPGASGGASAEWKPGELQKGAAVGLIGTAVVLSGLAVGTLTLPLLAPAALLGLAGWGFLSKGVHDWVVNSLPGGVGKVDASRPRIGMGATVSEGAVVEPGAVIEMGATISKGAVVRRGATVRMGATIGSGAVVESGAVVGWGVDVRAQATIGERAVVGAGATIAEGAVVPAGMQLAPGTTWSNRDGARSLPKGTAVPQLDPRLVRIDAACDRLEAELSDASANVKEFLGVDANTVATLRASCRALHARERVLRLEATEEHLHALEDERRALAAKLEATTDEAVKRSLSGALQAIDLHKEQRAVLQRSAERLDAELTRLILTVEGTTAQLLRLKAAGFATGADAERSGAQRLNEEVAAVVQAVEEISSDAPLVAAVPLTTRS